jgi:hypothetical protein
MVIKELTPLEQETEFQRRRNLPGVEVRRMYTKRTADLYLTLCGKELGSRHELLKRDKVASVSIQLPQLAPAGITRQQLDTIRVIYCAPYTCALYGIPYDMRRDVGQEPRHLWTSDVRGARDGWIHLDERDPVVRAWLDEQKALDNLPGHPHEWVQL